MPPSASVRINSFTTDICKCPPGLVFCGVSFVCENHTIIEKILPYNLWNFILFFSRTLNVISFLFIPAATVSPFSLLRSGWLLRADPQFCSGSRVLTGGHRTCCQLFSTRYSFTVSRTFNSMSICSLQRRSRSLSRICRIFFISALVS